MVQLQTMLGRMAELIGFDLIFLLLCLVPLVVLSKVKCASYAVLRRNFVGYFNNPTGYVFLCLFVLLSSFAAFWPHEFFASNLANLDQQNRFFPYIMLIFIPAITMSIWAEERRQGTDELLLTIPAGDLDIVLGKYLAAAAVYTVSLLFSQISNFAVLNALSAGGVDLGLFLSTYFGYWLVGMAMLAVGMVASFLTSNLTVGFILGAVFNAPFAFAATADVIVPSESIAQMVSRWSYSAQMSDAVRGVIDLAPVTFFVMLIVLGLYLSVVLIGRRHWMGGRDGQSMLGHFLLRAAALGAIVIGANVFLSHHHWFRYDATSEKISSLSSDTKKLIANLKSEQPIVVDAFISRSVPESYVKTKLDLVSMLRELQAMSGGKIKAQIHAEVEPSSETAAMAEEQYGIKPERVMTRTRGGLKQEEMFMGMAFSSGLDNVVVPFVDMGIPAEYELVRSICTVAHQSRKKLGVVRTDAELFGGFDMQRFTSQPKERIIEELEKQYEVSQVDPSNKIEVGKYDVLMVVQPSSLTTPQLDNLIEAIRQGEPTAIFEDPFPVAISSAPGTGQPRRPRGGGNMFTGGGQPPEPKGDIRKLWSTLGVTMVGNDGAGEMFDANIIWQDYNPYPKVRSVAQITSEWVFVAKDAPGADDPLSSKDRITSGLSQLLLLFPGAIKHDADKANGLTFTELVSTGDQTGQISVETLNATQDPFALDALRATGAKSRKYTLAARIQGALKDPGAVQPSLSPSPEEATDAETAPGKPAESAPVPPSPAAADASPAKAQRDVHVVFVTDIDCLHSDFLNLRAHPDEQINWRFDNVTFVLNVVDSLAGVEDFLDIRKRQLRHSTLTAVEEQTKVAREQAMEELAKYEAEYKQKLDEAKGELQKVAKDLEKKVEDARGQVRSGQGREAQRVLQEAMEQLVIQQQLTQRRLKTEEDRLKADRDRKLRLIDIDLDRQVRNVQSMFKTYAVLLPPLPPLVLGLVVYLRRRQREQDSITRERRR